MNNIQQNSSNSKPVLSLDSVCSKLCLSLGYLLWQSGFRKRSGVPAFTIFTHILKSIFSGAKSLHDLFSLKSFDAPECSYDAVMRFISNGRYNWSKLMLNLAKRACKIIMDLNNKEHINTLIIDDTIIERSKSSRVEGLSYTFNHVIGKSVKGFTNLLICWSDGFSTIPIASEMISSKNEKLIIRDFDKKIDHRTAGGILRAHAKIRKPELVVKLCKSILNKGIKAQYVLMDTWFYSDAMVASLNELGLHSICMIKKNLKFSFVCETRALSLKKILSCLKQKLGNTDIISAAEVESKSGQRFKLVFVRNRNNRKEFITILSTDTTLSSEKIVELYSRRWSIECCFKAAKQFLGLNSECFGRDFDTVSALNHISYIRFTIMEIIRRHAEDVRSYGQIFRDCFDEIRTIPFLDALESLSKCFESLVTKLDHAGCIVAGKLELAYHIANDVINKWYASICNFIAKMMRPENIPLILKN